MRWCGRWAATVAATSGGPRVATRASAAAAAAAAAVAIGSLALAPAAQADSVVVVDAQQDVEEYHYDDVPNRLRPDLAEGDIIKATYRNGMKRLVIRVKAREFTPSKRPHIVGLIHAWSDPYYFLAVKAPGKKIKWKIEEYYDDDGDTYRYRCPGTRTRFRNAQNTFTLSFPRKCFEFPKSVRIALYVGSGTSPPMVRLDDDPMRVGIGDYEPRPSPVVRAPKGARIWRGDFDPRPWTKDPRVNTQGGTRWRGE